MRFAQRARECNHHAKPARLNLVPEVLHGRAEASAFAWAECHSRVEQQAQHVVDVGDVLILRLGGHDDIVDVDEAAFPLDLVENDVMRPLDRRGCIRKPERMPLYW